MGLAKTGLADTPGRNSGCPVSYDFDSLPPRKIYNVRASSFAIKINLPTCRAELSLYWRIESDFRRRRGRRGKKIPTSFSREKETNNNRSETRSRLERMEFWRGEASRNCDKIDIARLFIIDWTVGTVDMAKVIYVRCNRLLTERWLTVFPVVKDLEMLFDAGGEGVAEGCDRMGRRHWPMKELADRRSLHHFRPRKACQPAETVRAIYYVT